MRVTTNYGKRRSTEEGGAPYYVERSGKWEAAYYVTLPGGSRVRRRVVADKAKAAAQKRKERLQEIEEATAMAETEAIARTTQQETVGWWMESWLDRHVRPYRKAGTVVTYETIVRKHISPALGEVPLRELSHERVHDFYTAKMAEGLMARTIGNIAIVLGRALKVARIERKVNEVVTSLVTPPKPAKFREEPLSPDEIRRVLDASAGSPFEAAIVVLATTGLRLGEALGLTWDQVDLEAGTLHVERALARVSGRWIMQTPKTEQSVREVFLTTRAIDALRRQVTNQKAARLLVGPTWEGPWTDEGGQSWDLCFTDHHGRPVNGRNVRFAFDAVLEAAGVRHVRIHSMRHGVATTLLEAGFPANAVAEQLGHADVKITLGIYGHVTQKVREDAARQIAAYTGG